MNQESLGVLLASGNVVRCHTLPILKPQTVGAHTWRVLVILHWLYAPAYPPQNLTHAALMHDTPELWTGDTPGDVKYDNPVLAAALERLEETFYADHGVVNNSLNKIEKELLSLCDRADLVMYCLDEVAMGNSFMMPIAKRAFEMADSHHLRLSTLDATTPRTRALMDGLAHRIALGGTSHG